ncbi:MAG: hypothetical protein U1E65_35540 [Myxococcota bacterium]
MKRSTRALGMAALAALLYGGWAFFANLGHGHAVAWRAATVQGCSSAFTTLVITSGIEALFALRRGRPWRGLLAAVLPPTGSALIHATAHLGLGTPEVFRTVLPSVVMGYVFAATYLVGLSRAAPEG